MDEMKLLNDREIEQVSGGLAIDRIEEVRLANRRKPGASAAFGSGLADGLAHGPAKDLADGIASSLDACRDLASKEKD